MIKKYIILILFIFILIISFIKWNNVIDVREELPIKIEKKNIIWGTIMAYHPDIFYKKYRIDFATKNRIIEVDEKSFSGEKYKRYYYLIDIKEKRTDIENNILKNDMAQTFLKYKDRNGNHYLFTVTGDHGGSANYRLISVKLYKYIGKKYELIWHKTETYSIDPGFDSEFFTERIKYNIYKIIFRDDRYSD